MGMLTWETCARRGMTLKGAAAARGVSYNAAYAYATANGVRFRPARLSLAEWDAEVPPNDRVPARRDHAARQADEVALRQLRAVAVEGLSGSEAAQRFGTTRSAVLGLLHRVRTEDIAESCTVRNGDQQSVEAVGGVSARYVRGASALAPDEAIFDHRELRGSTYDRS